MTAEELLEYKIKKETKKIELIKAAVGEFPKQEIPPANPGRHVLTAEQAHYYKRMGYKSKNYIPVGRRGIYGGIIQNIHLHWKKHETVQVEIVGFSEEEVRVMADHLERLSGGKLIDIGPKNIVLLWRGKNYEQPKVLVPIKTLDKRKALQKSKLEQSQQTHTDNLVRLEKELRILRKENAQKQTQLLPAGAGVQQGSENSVHQQVRTVGASGEEPRQYSRYSGDRESEITENHQELPLTVGDRGLSEEWPSHQESIGTDELGRVAPPLSDEDQEHCSATFDDSDESDSQSFVDSDESDSECFDDSDDDSDDSEIVNIENNEAVGKSAS